MVFPEAQGILEKLLIEKFHGVGKKSLNVFMTWTSTPVPIFWRFLFITDWSYFGTFWIWISFERLGGFGPSVRPNRVRKSIGSERTHGKLLYNEDDIKAELTKNARASSWKSTRKLKSSVELLSRSVHDFSTLTKRMTWTIDPGFRQHERIAHTIFDQLEENSSGVRLFRRYPDRFGRPRGRQLDWMIWSQRLKTI